MGRTLYESGPLSLGEKATPRGKRLQIAIAEGDGVAMVECGPLDAIALADVLLAWGAGDKAKKPPKQIAMRFCGRCGHIGFAGDVNRLDQVKPQRCDECDQPGTVVHLYGFEKTP